MKPPLTLETIQFTLRMEANLVHMMIHLLDMGKIKEVRQHMESLKRDLLILSGEEP